VVVTIETTFYSSRNSLQLFYINVGAENKMAADTSKMRILFDLAVSALHRRSLHKILHI